MTFPPPDLAPIERALEARRYGEVETACAALLRRDPNNASAHYLLGVAAFEQGRLAAATAAFERAVSLEPAEARHRARLAATLEISGAAGAARQAARAASELVSSDAQALDTLGVVLTRVGDYRPAVGLFERAVAAQPRNIEGLHNLGWGRQYVGDFPGAVQAYRSALALDPADFRAWQALAALETQTPERNAASTLETLFARAGGDWRRRLFLGHALAKTYEDLGEWGGSLDWLNRGKAGARDHISYDDAGEQAAFAAAERTGRAAGSGVLGAPVFVVGLPRTGTTLVERILSSHPRVASAGELMAFPRLVKRLTATAGGRTWDARSFAAADGVEPARLGAAYLEALRDRAGRTELVIDKLPFNMLFAGLIHRALPNARIVCVRRDPMDAVLSNYRQLFAGGALHAYAFDLARTARYVAMAERLMDGWRERLPADRWLEVRYEDVIADLEGQSRRMLAFLGLPFDRAVLDFHLNERGVQTASMVQVRRPIHDQSVGRWRRYPAEMLAPAIEALRAGGLSVA